jgi:pimeloyl-ACP methyl ester carboxylesterase
MGQRVNASDRLYLAANIPFMLVWGERDAIIPVEHGRAAHELVPSSRLEVFEQAGHFPHLDEPQRSSSAHRLHRVDRAGRAGPGGLAGDAEGRCSS